MDKFDGMGFFDVNKCKNAKWKAAAKSFTKRNGFLRGNEFLKSSRNYRAKRMSLHPTKVILKDKHFE